jgi:hypothetical protein
VSDGATFIDEWLKVVAAIVGTSQCDLKGWKYVCLPGCLMLCKGVVCGRNDMSGLDNSKGQPSG